MQHLEDFLDRLEGVERSGDGWKALCPSHDDRKPSLSITLGEGGRILVYCHAGCRTERVLRDMGLEGWSSMFSSNASPVATPRRPPELAAEEVAFRHGVYADLMDWLPLSDEHLQDLVGRGLPLDHGGYGTGYASIVAPAYHRVAADLLKEHGPRLFTVPGFKKVERKGYDPTATLSLTRGLCIPVRDAHGNILAIQVRTGEEGRKYQWLSGGMSGSSGCPVHVPLGVQPGAEIRITEGPLKADVATALDPAIPTIGVAGVSSWREALPVVDQLKPSAVRIAFDSDWQSKPPVRAAAYRLAAELDRRGYVVKLEEWDIRWKGIDDLLLAGQSPVTITPEVPAEVQEEIKVEQLKGAVIVCAEDVREEEVEWIWDGWLPRGALTIFDGDPGLGKSLLTADLAARISSGRQIPGGSSGRTENVLMLTSEDDYGRTVKPRLRQASALLSRVFFFPGVKRTGESLLALPEFPRDLEALREVVLRHEIRLVVVDPLYGHLDEQYDAHKDQHVRRVLAGLTHLAQETQTAILAIRHLNKKEGSGAIYRGSGSIGVIGQARVGWILVDDPEEGDGRHRLLGQVKNNLAYAADTQRLFILDRPLRVQWDGTDSRNARDLISPSRSSQKSREEDMAEAWLRVALSGGPRTPSLVFQNAEGAGYTRKQIERAAGRINVQKKNEGGVWYWSAPAERGGRDGVSHQEGAGEQAPNFDPAGGEAGAIGRLAPSDPAGAFYRSVAGDGSQSVG